MSIEQKPSLREAHGGLCEGCFLWQPAAWSFGRACPGVVSFLFLSLSLSLSLFDVSLWFSSFPLQN